jgi:hypothetical protein
MPYDPNTGGLGGFVESQLTVAPGETVYVQVGGEGPAR